MTDDFYTYPATGVLRNKLGLTNADDLNAFERRAVVARATEGVPSGDFDLAHLQAIYRHLAQFVSVIDSLSPQQPKLSYRIRSFA